MTIAQDVAGWGRNPRKAGPVITERTSLGPGPQRILMIATASYELKLDDLGLEAALSLPRDPGDLPEAPEFAAHLKANEGLVEVDEAVLADLIATARMGRRAGPRVISRGVEPQAGVDARLEWQGEFFESIPLERPDGSVDHFRRNKTSVAADTVIAEWIPPRAGSPGRSVTGAEIQGESGRPWRPKLHHTVAWADEEQTQIRALVGGQVEFAKDRVSISQVHRVSAVDFGSSSIDFDGAVDVSGDVLEGFGVHATGSVAINGYVETAPVVSGGNLTVKRGIIGRNKISVSADGDTELGFARELELNCGGQLLSRGELMWCTAQVGGDVTATGNRLVGGTWTISGSLFVAEIGSESETPTLVSVGIDLDLEEEQAERAEARLALRVEIQKRSEQIGRLERKRGRSDKEDLALQKLKLYLGQLDKRERELGEHERQTRRRIKAQRRRGVVWVEEGVYPGVKIYAGGKPQPLEVTKFIEGPLKIAYMPGRQKPAITAGRSEPLATDGDTEAVGTPNAVTDDAA